MSMERMLLQKISDTLERIEHNLYVIAQTEVAEGEAEGIIDATSEQVGLSDEADSDTEE